MERSALSRWPTMRSRWIASGRCRRRCRSGAAALDAALEDFGIAHLAGVPVRLLSSGQLKRATLARVAASGAPLWLLDEPLNALDTDGCERLGVGAGEASRRGRRGPRRVAPAAARRLAPDRPGAKRMIGALIARDVRRALAGHAWLPIAFFALVVALMPFAVGPDARVLARIGPGVLWVAALTAALLPIERLIEPDRADGVLDQLAIRGVADESVALAKIVAHWLTFGPLLLVAAIPGAALLGMDGAALLRAELALAIGTVGAGGAGGGRRGGHRRPAARRRAGRAAAAAARGSAADFRGCRCAAAGSGGRAVADRRRAVRRRRGDPGRRELRP